MRVRPTFDDANELLHVVVCFPIVHHRSNREDQLGLDLREPVENTLQVSTAAERRLKTGTGAQKIRIFDSLSKHLSKVHAQNNWDKTAEEATEE